MTDAAPDVVIVGGGVIGCAIARRAALGGLRVLVLERGVPGAEASFAAAGIEHVPIAQTWSGLRPGTPDGLPILGGDPKVANLHYATGHFRNGILFAPLTGDAIAATLLGETPDPDLREYGIGRFE